MEGVAYPYRYETPELAAYWQDWKDWLAGRVFDWEKMPMRWRMAMRLLTSEREAVQAYRQAVIEAHLKRL